MRDAVIHFFDANEEWLVVLGALLGWLLRRR
jgi:hypothetical protein